MSSNAQYIYLHLSDGALSRGHIDAARHQPVLAAATMAGRAAKLSTLLWWVTELVGTNIVIDKSYLAAGEKNMHILIISSYLVSSSIVAI